MADADGAEENQEVEETVDDVEALVHIIRICDARRSLPWEQWSFREKVNYYIDRAFLGLLIIFLVMLFGEISYKVWFVTDVRKIAAFVSGSVVRLVGWLFTQEEQEELIEL